MVKSIRMYRRVLTELISGDWTTERAERVWVIEPKSVDDLI